MISCPHGWTFEEKQKYILEPKQVQIQILSHMKVTMYFQGLEIISKARCNGNGVHRQVATLIPHFL